MVELSQENNLGKYFEDKDFRFQTNLPFLHPVISYWMRKYNLEICNTDTEFGYIATPKNLPDKKIEITQDIEFKLFQTLQQTYGNIIKPGLTQKKGTTHNKTLIKTISQLREEGKDELYIGGITIPKRKGLYIEYILDGIQHFDSIPL